MLDLLARWRPVSVTPGSVAVLFPYIVALYPLKLADWFYLKGRMMGRGQQIRRDVFYTLLYFLNAADY